MLERPTPYGIAERPMPSGLSLDQLLPPHVGPYLRTGVELSSQQGVPATEVLLDGDSIYAHYRSGKDQMFIEFAISRRAEDAQAILEVAASNSGNESPGHPRLGSLGTEPSYLKVDNEYGALFAWKRGGYYFSASTKSGEAVLDAFMQSFPY